MRKFTTLVLLLSLLTTSVQSVFGQARPRRVGPNGPTTNITTNPPSQTPNTPQRTQTPPSPSSHTGGAETTQRDAAEEVGEDDVVRVNTTLVTIPVSVLDRDGRYIPSLGKGDFRILEDGVEQEIAYFASVETPFTVALVLDTSGSTRFKVDEMQNAAIAFIDQLRADDRVLVVSFDDQVRVLSEATNDRRQLRNAIRQTRTGSGTRLYEAVDYVIKQRLSRIDGRKAIVLFTDGVDTTSKRASYSSNVADAEELDAIIYPIQYDTYSDMANSGGGGGGMGGPTWPGSRRWPIPNIPIIIGRRGPFPVPGGGGGGGRGAGTTREEYRRGGEYLRDMASKTGGRVYQADDLRYLEQAFTNIAEELRRQYSLGYYPSKQSQTSERRSIRVRVKRPNLVVRARDSYIYKPSGGATAERDDLSRPAPPELRRRQLVK